MTSHFIARMIAALPLGYRSFTRHTPRFYVSNETLDTPTGAEALEYFNTLIYREVWPLPYDKFVLGVGDLTAGCLFLVQRHSETEFRILMSAVLDKQISPTPFLVSFDISSRKWGLLKTDKDRNLPRIIAWHLFRFLGLINLPGITLTDSKHSATRRTRIRKNHLIDFKTLTIEPGKVTVPSSPTGTHASPRLHLRRGHVRRYKSGKVIHIAPMLVGDKSKGFIAKDYKIK